VIHIAEWMRGRGLGGFRVVSFTFSALLPLVSFGESIAKLNARWRDIFMGWTA